jgi:hypothetical protein
MSLLPESKVEIDQHLKDCAKIAVAGGSQHYELYAQRFTDMVNSFIHEIKGRKRRKYIRDAAKNRRLYRRSGPLGGFTH